MFIRVVLLKGTAQYGWPPCTTNQFRSASIGIENTTYLFYKTGYINEEVNCAEPSPLVSILCVYNTGHWSQVKKLAAD